MAPSPEMSREGPAESPGDGAAGDAEPRSRSEPNPAPISSRDALEAEGIRDHLERARRLVALELDLAETRRRLAEDNLKLTEAQLELAERELEEVKAENERLRREIEELRGGS